MDLSKDWYVLHTYSGYENKVKENLEMRKESMKMENNIFRVEVPEEEVTVMQEGGGSKTKMEKTFPGYALVHTEPEVNLPHYYQTKLRIS